MFKKGKIISWVMILTMLITLLPNNVYAFDADNYRVNSITIGKTYDRNRILNNMYVTITGKNLQNANVGIITYAGGYVSLGIPEINSDGILQFELTEDQLGEYLSIEGVIIPINEGDMPTLTEITRRVKIGEDDLIIKGTRLTKVNDPNLNIEAKYGKGNSYITLDPSIFNNDTEVTIEKPTGELGLQEFVFTSQFTNTGIDFNDNNKDQSVDVQINYTYVDQFRFIKTLDIEGTLEMFPNRGEAGDTVYFTADKLDEYDVFFLKTLDGTDPYSNENKALNSTYKANGSSDGKDILTAVVPDLPVGEYYVVITNKISDDKDPMEEVIAEAVLSEKFTIIDSENKIVIIDVQPDSGPDTGDLVTIYGQFIGSLNIDEFIPDDTKIQIDPSSSDTELKISYGSGTYGTGDNQVNITSAIRSIRVIIGDKANFVESNGDYEVSFNSDLDKITVRTSKITDADINPVKDVVIETETILTKENGETIIIKERAVKEDGYTFIVSKLKPEITEVVPSKIQVINNNGLFQIPSDRYIAIYGENFMIHKYVNEDGREVVRYPIVYLGPSLVINKNNDDEDFLDSSKSLTGKEDVFLKIFDDNGIELDGSDGSEIGSKILIKLEEDSPEGGVTLGKTYVQVVNPMRNSKEMGLDTKINDFIEFVNPEETKNPVIQDVSPNVVSVDGGEEILVTGSNFTEGVKVFIDGAEVENIERGDDGKTITFIAPEGREGETQLQVMNIEGGMDTYPFFYVKTFTNPQITSIEPRRGNTGTLVVIKGDNFLKPDPTGGESDIYRLIGTRVLLEGKEINSYNINASTKEIELQELENPKTPLFSIEDNVIKVASYYHSILLKEAGGKFYTVEVTPSGVAVISDGVGNEYTVILDDDKTSLKADKTGGGLFDLEISGDEIIINEENEDLVFKIVTPFEVNDGEIVGDLVKVVDKNTIYFTVPILDADGWYDVTVQNPDTKKDTKYDEDGFYYYKQPLSSPIIYEIEPSEGSVYGGNIITIKGEEFIDNGDKKVRVFINGVEVSPDNVEVSTDGNSINVEVPPYDGDLIEDKGVGRLTVPVVVINPDGGNYSKEDGYTYVVPSSHPEITRIIPTSGSAAGGEVVEIFGSDFRSFEPFEDYNRDQKRDDDEPYTDLNGNGEYDDSFDFDAEENKIPLNHPLYSYYYDSPILPRVYFGMEKAKIVEFSDTYIKVITPEGEEGSVSVFVENNDSGTSNSVSYTYEASNPIITKVSPEAGSKLGGTNVGVYGSGFEESLIKVYESTISKEEKNMTLVQFGDNTNKDIPRYEANSGLLNQGNAQVSLEQDFVAVYKSIYDEDTNSTSEITMSIKYNDVVYSNTFKGFNDEESFINTNLLVDSEGNRYPFSELVRFYIKDRRFIVERGFSPEVTYVSSRELSVTTPPYYTVDTVPIRVINPDGGEGESSFTYLNPDSSPTIIDITNQNTSPVSETITLDGKEITARVIRVNYKGGNTIKVIGSDFRENAIISIGEVLDINESQINYDNIPTILSFEMPAVSEDYIGEYYRLVVLNEDGGSASSDELDPPIYITFIKGESDPEIKSITPTWGPSAGGTKVTIEGKDFRSSMEGFTDTIHVYFGEIPANDITVSSDGKYVYVITPAHEAGEVEVKVQNPDGTIVKAPENFTFISNPKINKITDVNEINEIETLSMAGEEEIKLKGYGFKEGARVYFNPVIKKVDENSTEDIFYIEEEAYILESGTEALDVEFIDEETVKVITPPGNKDNIGVILINEDGGASNIYKISYAIPEIEAPENVMADLIYDRYIKIIWSEVSEAKEYEVYVVEDENNMELIGVTKTTSFIYEDLKPRTSYEFIVKAVGEFNISKASMKSNRVRTGSSVGIPDSDGELNEETTINKNGNYAEVIIGTKDYDNSLTIDLTRGDLRGVEELTISMSAEIVTSYIAEDIVVIGKDFTLVLNPRAFKTNMMMYNKDNDNAGVKFKISQGTGSYNLESGYTALSSRYVLEASQYVGKNSEEIEYLASDILFNLDYDGNMARTRRLEVISFSRYDSLSGKWTSIKQTSDNDQMAIGTYIDRLGEYMVIGSKR
ncbi:IPT/TIG domain-containing protein [Defluviitalea phaphyphila]|uniref:IPT/TIG domain-containing protein n=1 Tax=Defluviitalea phaphyphila TaxID=1473580 RepID=UPI000731CE83|nr:IPT/TIG domain-containing protein [Defluviitalea phaphyphila]